MALGKQFLESLISLGLTANRPEGVNDFPGVRKVIDPEPSRFRQLNWSEVLAGKFGGPLQGILIRSINENLDDPMFKQVEVRQRRAN
jgi:hypothetical protein